MRAARAVIVWLLLPAAIAGALTLSAAATIALAEDAGIPAGISPAAVGMLEIVSLTGTLLWVVVDNATLRRDAVLATVAASLVSLVAGFHAYGLFGAVAPLALVGVVHLASRAWRESWAAAPDEAPAVEPEPLPVAEPVERLTQSYELPPAPDEEAELAQQLSPAAFAAHRLEHGSTAGVKKLRKHYPDLTEHQARQVSETARREHAERRTPRLVVGGER